MPLPNWLKRLMGLCPSKDTEAMRLKSEIRNCVAVQKEKSAAGDESATLKLEAFKENVTEQSLRMLKRPGPKALGFILLMVLALGVGGCGGGLGAKTAKDIEVASEMILPEYLQYVEADPKLKDRDKQERRDQVRAFRNAVQAAQK